MATFADVISRSDASALMPEEVQKEIVQGIVAKSAALQLFPHVKMSRAQTRIPVLSAMPSAYWVTPTDTGQKQTTNAAWANKYLDAAEIAVIVPMPKTVLADADYDVWGQLKPRIVEAFGIALDNAVFFGVNKPAEWTNVDDIVTAATAASNVVEQGTSTVDIVEDISNAMALVEADGFDVDGFFARIPMKATLRNLRDKNNQLLFFSGGPANTGVSSADMPADTAQLFGRKIAFSRAGLSGFDAADANAAIIMGDFSQGMLGIRQDIDMEMFDTGVINDDSGVITHNLLQEDKVALRVTARYAFQVPNPISRSNTNASTRYPFAVLSQP